MTSLSLVLDRERGTMPMTGSTEPPTTEGVQSLGLPPNASNAGIYRGRSGGRPVMVERKKRKGRAGAWT